MKAAKQQFESREFLVLPENQLAVACVSKLAPKLKRRAIRLVTVVADPGNGKTLLAKDLVRSWELERTDKKVIYVTASQFAAQFAEAATTETIPQFQKRYRQDVALFVCEDLQILGSRRETQTQLQSTIDDVISNGGVVLLTSTLMPGSIRGMSRNLVNRMHGGLCVSIDLPGYQSRRKILENLQATTATPVLFTDLEQIAKDYAVSPRELSALLSQIRSEAKLLRTGRPASRESIKTMIDERSPANSMTLTNLCRLTASQFGVKLVELRGPSRAQTLALARQTAMFMAREHLRLNYIEIGEFFNRGNHSTVIHACRKIETQRLTDPDLDVAIQAIHDSMIAAGVRA